MTNHVTSLPLSKRLDEAGVEQTSEFYWVQHPTKEAPLLRQLKEKDWDEIAESLGFDKKLKPSFTSAFLASELLEGLPKWVASKKHEDYDYELVVTKSDHSKGYEVGYFEPTEHDACLEYFVDKSLPEAAGEMKLWVIENKYEN